MVHRATTPEDWKGTRLRMSWIKEKIFPIPHQNVDNLAEREQYARAFILLMIGSRLFPDNSGVYLYACFLPLLDDLRETGEYSWGGATLAWLYRQLCRASRSGATDIWGPLILLQLWAYEHITFTRPTITTMPNNQDGELLPLGYK
jgi:hypothetical protein